jgi:dihydrolipoamide dehydrogenase
LSDAEQFDIVYLGGGTGGYVSAIRAAQLGLRSVIVEKYRVGGTCLHRGCIPSKALLQSAKVLDTVRHGGDFGVDVAGDVTFNYAKVLERKDQVVAQNYRGVQFLLKKANATIITGEGKLSGPGEVTVRTAEGERSVRGKHVVINTGSSPRPLPGVPFDGDRILSSDDCVQLSALPASIVIVGAGAIGVEFATFYHSAGVKVTLVELLPSIVPLEDSDVGAELEKLFVRKGMTVFSGVKQSSIDKTGSGVRVTLTTRDDKQETIEAEKVLVAIGRAPNSADVGLDQIGITLDRGFITVDGQMRTNVPGVYAIGDVVRPPLLAHKAMHEGIVAAEAIAGREPEPIDVEWVPRCTYSQPQVASLGISEAEALQRGRKVKIGRFPFRAIGKAAVEGNTEGFAKIIADHDTGELLGVYLLGNTVTELIDAPGIAHLLESTVEEIGIQMHAHPTLAEILGEAALAVDGMAIHL